MWIDDQILRDSHKALAFETWVPEQPLVVIGNSNDAAAECYLERCDADHVEVLQRYGGGGAVVLYNGCVIISLGLWVKDYYRNGFYFTQLNDAVIATLAKTFPSFAD